jgi:hypothetical protein
MALDDIPIGTRPSCSRRRRRPTSCRRASRPQKRTDTRRTTSRSCATPECPSRRANKKALQKFAKAGEEVGFNVEFIRPEDFARLGEFDALFLRETTSVNHHTFRFAEPRRSARTGRHRRSGVDPALLEQGVPRRDGRPAGHPACRTR